VAVGQRVHIKYMWLVMVVVMMMIIIIGKSKFHPRTGHEGQEVE
jgi:hypothetical protein